MVQWITSYSWDNDLKADVLHRVFSKGGISPTPSKSQFGNFLNSIFLVFCPYFVKHPSKPCKIKMLGVYHKIQEIFSKMGTKFIKIDGEMPKIIETKDGNPQIEPN